MRMRDFTRLVALGSLALVVGGCAFGFMGQSANVRPTNVEVRIVSQSCFQGEIEPCG